ncbi:MAG: hypothetical protein LBU37_02195 [Tannerellaceae bacterium]|nr:hypothetical protein [Tannerellaceae bacterium]
MTHLTTKTIGIALRFLPVRTKRPLPENANSVKSVSEQAITLSYCKGELKIKTMLHVEFSE